ncbi:uncharacterized protein LOC107269512 isoform X2 [Cephus cinctus]|uniref:Uncharacterized protein LOC107269512 isoform X2 n=1 Tax=Cephus cinctus TaxID=211228 RepID=A0AAJ7C0M3_CEPCN|nr:uncharacterized protein LOC107269512 isoform X2 [Cephus cinctus]
MEKFAVDLDKVLDEFEFNEDQAEQIASVAPVDDHVTSSGNKSSSQNSVSKSYDKSINDSVAVADTECDVSLSSEKYSENQAISIVRKTSYTENEIKHNDLDILKGEQQPFELTDSTNHFYTHDYETEKVQAKQPLDIHDTDPVSLTIHNDISQKLLQKRHNDNSATKIQNSYDKKLNQSNIKPSVSNVFSSLNEYINAPSASVDYVDDAISSQDYTEDSVPQETTATVEAPTIITVKNGNVTKSVDKKIAKIEEISDVGTSVIKITNTVPPKYQNILLPVKLDTVVADKPTGSEEDTITDDTPLPESIEAPSKNPVYTNVTLPEVAERTSVDPESIIDRPEHVYENVYIGTDIPKTQELYATVNKTKPKDKESRDQAETRHTYENVDFGEPNKVLSNDKENVYECIYIGNRETLPETTTELEIAAKKMADHLYVNQKSIEAEAKAISSTKLIFKNVHLKAPQPEHKPVGFSHIDDLSEEELNKYLAELEAEERAAEESALYENSTLPGAAGLYVDPIENFTQSKFQNRHDDEDANEAPIFESVTIGELPEVSEEELQQKAKKFPVIDYSKSGPSGEVSSDFLAKKGLEKFHEPAKVISEAKENKEKERKSKRTNEKMGKTSDNTEPNVMNSNASQEDEKNVEPTEIISKTKETHLEKTNTESQNEKISEQSERLHSQDPHEKSLTTGNSQQTKIADTNSNIEISGKEPFSNLTEENVIIEKPSTVSSINLDNKESASTSLIVEDNNNIVQDNAEGTTDNNTAEAGTSNPSENLEINGEHVDSSEEDSDKPSRPQTLDIISSVNMDEQPPTIGSPGVTPGGHEQADTEGEATDQGQGGSPEASENSSMEANIVLGKQPPFWVPDCVAPNCMLCDVKFTVIKRRHHCRACGKVLCSKCCGMKYRLEYQGNVDSRVCLPCYQQLVKAENENGGGDWSVGYGGNGGDGINSPQGRQPNPNNPMEYCSTIPPLQQLAGGLPPTPTVMVPVGVLKREGSTKQRPEGQKSVMFSDELDSSWDPKPPYRKPGNKRLPTPPGPSSTSSMGKKQNLPPLDPNTNSYIPQDPNVLPPTVTIHKGQITYHDVLDQTRLYKSLENECEPPVLFAINRNLYAYVKITNLNCCVNRVCWNVTSRGLACVGQDEVILLVETLPDETQIPKDLLIHINQIYIEAIKGNTITELGVSIHQGGNFLGSREHAGFLFIRQTFQCLQKIVLPPAPFLVGLLVHRWETPWAKVFPLRLVLRLGAEYRYYPCPLVSVRFRDAVYYEIGHTIMKILADFRNFAYTLPGVRGLTIHMQDRTTDVMFPRNRYDQVIRGLNNSNDHVLAYAANFSVLADSHLVCMQTNKSDDSDESNYQTQAINIHNKPRKVTGASFVVINGALKSSMGLSAKSSIVEDGLMVQIMPEKMEALKAALKNMQDFSIGCGRQGAPEPDETVNIKWVDNDVQFNLGVKSPIDGKPMDGIPSIRVHNGTDHMGTSRFIRWTEVFIIKSEDHPTGVHDPVDINKLSENIARATCAALVKLLDLLATAGLTKLAVRTTIHPDNVGYEAGSEGTRLPPIYMKSLDNELIQVLHKAVQSSQDTYTVLELIFHVLDD